jgi:hypothetical protein
VVARAVVEQLVDDATLQQLQQRRQCAAPLAGESHRRGIYDAI